MEREKDSIGDASRFSRRALLRTGAFATIGLVGLPRATATVTARGECPHPAAYWATHWHDSLGEQVSIPPAGSLTRAEIQTVLGATENQDTVTELARAYLATYLNLWLRTDPDPTCADRAIYVWGIGMTDWTHVKNAAQAWLRVHDWDGTVQTGTRSWEPAVPVGGTSAVVTGDVLVRALDAFNNGRFGQLDCNCNSTDAKAIEESTTIRAPGYYRITDDIGTAGRETCIRIASDDVVLDGRGHTIDGNGSAQIGILIGNSEQDRLRNVVVKNVALRGFEMAGIATERASGGAIRSISATESGRGLDLRATDDFRLTDNTLTDNDVGIVIRTGSADTLVARSTVAGNKATGAVVRDGARGIVFSQNQVRDNGGAGIQVRRASNDVRVLTNTVRDNAADGINLAGTSRATIQWNRLIGNEDGIRLWDGTQCAVEKNTVAGNVDDGIAVLASARTSVRNNTVFDNGGTAIVMNRTNGNRRVGNLTD